MQAPAEVPDGMAVLRHTASDVLQRLPPRTIVGRGPRSDLRLEDRRCSTQHAELRWQDDRWVVRDLASRNGTWLEGRRLEAAEIRDLRPGMLLAFGNPPDTWEVHSIEPPVACARAPDGTLHFALEGLLVLPSPDRPLAFLDGTPDGRWWLEQESGRMPCPQDSVIWLDEQPWQILAPQAGAGTTELEVTRSLTGAHLTFHVSPDEEHVVIDLLADGVLTRLDSRAHSYLLVLLARQFLQDIEAGLSVDEAGWLHLADQLAPMLATSPNDVNVQVFRARQQLKEHGVEGAPRIVERSAGRLRLGPQRVVVQRHTTWPPPTPL